MNEKKIENPYNMSTTPKNSWELFKWIFTEPIKLEKFSTSLLAKKAFLWYLKVSIYIFVFSLISLLVINFFPIFFSLSPVYIDNFQLTFLKINSAIGLGIIIGLLLTFIKSILEGLIGGLTITAFLLTPIISSSIVSTLGIEFGILIAFLVSLNWNIKVGLASGLMVCLLISLIGSHSSNVFPKNLNAHIISGLIIGYIFNILANYIEIFVIGILFSIVTFLFLSIFNEYIIIYNIAFLLAYLVMYLRLHIILYHSIKYHLIQISLYQNPYLDTGFSPPFSLFRLENKIMQDSFKNPTLATYFIHFLFKFRPYQRSLAFELSNIVDASLFYNNPLTQNTIKIPKDYEEQQPRESFTDHLTQYSNELNTYHTQNNLQFKKVSLQTVINILKKLEEDMIRESREWKEYYLKAIHKNLEVAQNELKTLELKLKNKEPIQANIYRMGNPLSPMDKIQTFKGRVDMIDALSRIVHTSITIPLLFIQGQRRVGKTSLLNYLEVLLGSGFKIIKIDMQQARNKKFIKLLENLNKQINTKLGIGKVVEFKGDTNDKWIAFEEYLEEHTKKLNYKLIIAFDEYENFHNNIAIKEPEVLKYMRGFLQNQEQVLFLFVGLRDISELTNPNWDEYFPQIQKLRVDYLSSEDSKELITHPVPDFSLIYDARVINEIIELTQGHPQLLQTICSIIVDITNTKGIKEINQAILDEAKGKIFEINEGPINIFWREYCDDTQRVIIEQILASEPIIQETKEQKRALLRLKEYGFITSDNTIRVPLFEKWLIERRELIEI